MRIGYGTSVTVPSQQERWFSEMRAGRCFTLGRTTNASVGNFSEAQLFNPVGSIVTVLVYQAKTAEVAADAVQLRVHNTALATLAGTGVNLLIGAAASVAEYRQANPAALDGTAVLVIPAPASDTKDVAITWLAELGAGEGILLASNTVNQTLYGTYFWNEVPS